MKLCRNYGDLSKQTSASRETDACSCYLVLFLPFTFSLASAQALPQQQVRVQQ